MIKVEEVKKARLNELFFATIKKKPAWEEVGSIKIGESLDYPSDMSPSKVLYLSIDILVFNFKSVLILWVFSIFLDERKSQRCLRH